MRTTLHYRPGLNVWSFLLVTLVTTALALLARWDGRVAQSVTCTTARGADKDTHLCWAFDARTGETRSMPCDAARGVLADLLGPDSLLALPTRPFVNAQSTVGPLEPRPVPARFVTIERMSTAAFPNLPPHSASDEATARTWPKVERAIEDSVTRASALALLTACAVAPPAEREVRTVSIAVFPRDARGSVAVVLLGLVSLVWLIARRARIEVAPETGEVRITERVGFLTKGTLVLASTSVVDVVVTKDAVGPLLARRVELVLADGARIPLLSRFVPLGAAAHERARRHLRRALGLLPA